MATNPPKIPFNTIDKSFSLYFKNDTINAPKPPAAADKHVVTNTSDVVPNLPPSIILDFTYTHTGFDMPFTLNLSNRLMNHINAYLDYYNLDIDIDHD